MFDTIGLCLIECLDERYLSTLFLDKKKLSQDLVTKELFVTGKLGNLLVRAKETKIVLEGSLAKYYLGSNIETLTRKDTELALESLSDELGLNMKNAKVKRLDAGTNFIVREPIIHYCNALAECSRYERVAYRNGVLYKNTLRTMSFYDKVVDLKRHKEAIPTEFEGQHILRYELQFKNQLERDLGIIKASDLYQQEFYVGILNRWQHEYFNIRRQHIVNNEFLMDTEKDFWRYIKFTGLSTVREPIALALINNMLNLDKWQRSRLKAKVRESLQANGLTEPNSLLNELDTKIKQIVACNR